jgi:lysophospholipase L1-like esterase
MVSDKQKLVVFKCIAILAPFVLLLIVELSLRWFGYGHPTSLFVKDPDDATCWVMNPYASARFFSDSANATKGNIEPFPIEKAPNTFRVFVLGESTTAGYPYMHNGSFHRWLQYRLMRELPEKNIEIINVALTAVNSYTVLDFGKEVLHYQPDAVLVYVGHNEYYGALGVGSSSRIANNYYLVQAVLKLRQLRLVQWMTAVIRKLTSLFSGDKNRIDQRDNLMKRVASKQEIAYGSDDYTTGIRQFERNMDELCQAFAAARIPVFLSTVVSNEKDQRPFISDTLTAGQPLHLSAPPEASGASGPSELYGPASSVLSANAAYRQADSAFAAGDYATAKRRYVCAKELDLLRFRAPEAINTAIRALTKKYEDVHLVDAYALFEQQEPKGILGNETLLEHVHPNLYGYALLSEAFYQSMKQQGLVRPDGDRELSFSTLLSEMPVTRVDSLYGAWRIMMLKTGWPFNQPIPAGYKRGNSVEEEIAGALSVDRITWTTAMDQLFKYYMRINDKRGALKATEAVLLEHPRNVLYYIYSGRLNFDLGRYDDALFYFKKAWTLEPTPAHAENIYLFYLKTNEPEKAREWIPVR